MTPAGASELVIVKRPATPGFTQIQNDLIRNPGLSWKALGILVYLLSLPPRGYHISLERICGAKLDGEASVRTAMKQLESLGYLKIVRERSTAGRFVRTRWLVSDEPVMDWAPHLEKPVVDSRAQVQPDKVDPGATNTELLRIKMIEETTTESEAHELPFLELDGEDRETWLWLCQKLSINSDQMLRDCHGLDVSMVLDVMAETYECNRQGSIRKTVPQFLASLLRKARAGAFHLSAGANLRKELPQILARQRALQTAASTSPEKASQDSLSNAIPPKERLRQLREQLARGTHVFSLPGANE